MARRRDLLAMGFVGGLLPSPSAVIVLLGAIALARIWFGIVLVLAYGLGMAATLTVAGMLLLRARGSSTATSDGSVRAVGPPSVARCPPLRPPSSSWWAPPWRSGRPPRSLVHQMRRPAL